MNEFFEKLLEAAPDAMVITNHEGTIIMINAQTEQLFGFTRDEIVGEKVELLIPEKFRQLHSHHRNGYVENPKVRGMGVGMELYGKRKDGQEFPVEISLSPVTINENEDIMVISAIRDITKQIEWKSEIKKRTLELETINKELEAFSYSVSHDLRAPLRSIDGFSNKILKDYGHLFDEQGKDYFNRVKNASQKMGHLIDDLLKLSRISRIGMSLEIANLSALAGSIAMELKTAFPERKADFVIQPDMLAQVDRNLIQIALQNLLGNALKYSINQPVATIEFGSFIRDNMTVYFVRDNGVGFDMKYVSKLFGAFQRLHSAQEFDGTGIGLATVQRIIRRHQGTIWAEAEINNGATFYFTL